MPHAIAYAAEQAAAFVFRAAVAAGVKGGTAIILAKTAYFLTSATLAAASTYAIAAATAQTPKPEVVKEPVNQTRPEVRQGYGRMRISGPRALYQSLSGANVESQMLHEGRIDGFEQVYLHDTKVTLKESGYVNGIGDAYADDRVGIWLRPGRPTEIPTPDLVAICGDDWTADHRNDGIAALDMIVKSVKDKYLTARFPNGNPKASVVARLSLVYDWRDETQDINDPSTWKWSQNACVCHATWEWYGRYLRKASEDNVTPNARQLAAWAQEIEPALDFWTTAADVCDELVELKDSTFEARYTVALMTLSQDDEDTVRQTFLKAYDGWMIQRSDGAWNIRAGAYVTPTFEVTDANLIELNWERGLAKGDRTNILEGSFLSPDNDYTSQAIDPWIDADGVTAWGEQRETWPLDQVPQHGQARRLLKREIYRRQAARRGTITMDLSGLRIADEAHRWIRIVRGFGPLSMRNVVVEITGEAQVDFSRLSVTFPIRVSGANIDSWFPPLEEGFKPNDTDRTVPDVLPPPEILDAWAEFQSDRSALIVVKIVNPDDDTRLYQVSILDATGAALDGAWQDGDVAIDGLVLRAGPVGLGEYTVIVRANVAGRETPWSTPPLAVHVNHEDAPYFPPTYDDGTDINELRPAEEGADVTGNHTSNDTSNVGGVPVATVLGNINASLLENLRNALDIETYQAVLQALMYDPAGETIQLVALNALTKATNIETQLTLIGALSEDSSAFVIQASTVKIDATTTLADYILGVQTTIAGHTSSITANFEAINAQSARVTIAANANGHATGLNFGVDGDSDYFGIVSSNFYLVDESDPDNIIFPVIYNGSFWTFNADMVINGDLLVNGTISTTKIADNAISDEVSVDCGLVTNLSSQQEVLSTAFNPRGGKVRIDFKLAIDNPGGSDCALRVKIFRDGSNISGSILKKVGANFTENWTCYINDYSLPSSTVVYSMEIQTVTGTDIGDTGGTGYASANLASGNMTIRTKLK